MVKYVLIDGKESFCMFEFNIIIDKDIIIALNKFHFFKKINPIFLLMFGMFNLILLLLLEMDKFAYAGLLAGSYVFLIIFYIIMIIAIKSVYKKPGSNIGGKMYFRLDEEIVYDKSESKDLTSIVEAKWSYIFAAYETRNYFILYNTVVTAFTLPKRCLTTGDPLELRKLLSAKLGPKFVITKFKI
ncbi:MAG: YcxB family protein [Clostridia bacterium]|nr:YcxB family protein [Clostridia bacterium]